MATELMRIKTRWSINCRFKGVFTPYADKKLGNFLNQSL